MKDYKKTIEALQVAMKSFEELEKLQSEQPTISFEEGIENTGGKCPSFYDREIAHTTMKLRRWTKRGNRSFLLLVDDEKGHGSVLDFGGDYQNIYNSLVDAFSCDHVFRNLVKKALKNAD